MVTLTLRVRNADDVISTHPTWDEAVRVAKACTTLPGNQITGWSMDGEDDE